VRVRSIQALEIAVFAERSAGPDRGFAPEDPDAFLEWLDARWLDGRSAPGLCFVAESDNATLASVVFWRHADMAHVEHLHGSEETSAALLAAIGPALTAQGSRRIWAESGTPDTPDERQVEVARIFPAAGMRTLAPGVRIEIDPATVAPAADSTLCFRDFDEVGRGAFIDAMARCTSATMDPQVARDVVELGSRGDAEQRIDRLLELEGDRAWWQLAYSADGDLAGMVLPNIAGGHVIGFVGVVPHWRGRGIAQQIVRRATATLAAAGATRVRADASTANEPMVRAFEAVGFRPFATRHVWERTLTGGQRQP